MTKEDFDGIEPDNVILINSYLYIFEEFTSDDWLLTSGYSWNLNQIDTLSVLTGKLAPWSSPFVPDWAEGCIQNIDNGNVAFVSILYSIQFKYDNLIITKRPSWRKNNV